MKKFWSRILVLFMIIVTIFQVAVPPEMCFNNAVYAAEEEEELPWYKKLGKAAAELFLNGVNFVVHQIPGADLIMETLRTALEGTEFEGLIQYLTMKEYIPEHTGWYRPLITSANDATGITDLVNATYNELTDSTDEKNDLFIYYHNKSGDKVYPEYKRDIEFRVGTSLFSQKVYLVKGTVYYIPRYMYLRITRDSILETIEAMAANFVYSIANGLHYAIACALGTSVTIDDLVFNLYEETDISYFEKQTGGKGSSLIYGKNGVGGLDSVINEWYAIFQRIALMGYMAILVYMGIRIMLGSTAEQKANYKQLFVDWVIGIAILLLFPYAMKYTIKMNEAFVRTIEANKGYETKTSAVIENIDTSKDYDKISIDDVIDWENGTDYMSQMAYAAKTSEKIALSIVFLIMTWQLIALIAHYYKRLFMIAFLIIIFPLVALSYAIDKIADGKSQAFNTWFKEYFLNVFIQSFHAIVYVFVCSTIYSAAGQSGAGYDYILIIIGVTFLFKGEEIVKSIFGQTSAAGTMKKLSESAVGIYAKMSLATKGVQLAASHTFGEKSVVRKVARARNNFQAIKARENAFDATAKPNAPMNTGLRLEHAPQKPPEGATPEQQSQFAENLKNSNAAAVVNNPKSHSYMEKAKAQDRLKNLAETDPDNDVFKDTKDTVGQFRALNTLDRDVQRMIMAGQDPLEIERNITARLAMIFPNEKGKQLEDRVNTYLTGLYLKGPTKSPATVTRTELEDKVNDTLRAIEREEDSVKFCKNGEKKSSTGKEIHEETEAIYSQYVTDDMTDDEKKDIKKLAESIAMLNKRKNGELFEKEFISAVDNTRKHAYDNEITRKMVEENLDSELDIDTFAHAAARKMIDSKADNEIDKSYHEIAREIVNDYEANPRDGYFDDEISAHELIKYKGDADEIERIIDRTFEKSNEYATELSNEAKDVAQEILATRRVDILKGSYDTETPLQEGRTKDEVMAMKLSAASEFLDDLNPFSKSDGETRNTSFLDLYAKHLILKSEEERSGVTRTWREKRIAMDPKSERKSRYDFDTEILMNVDDFIDYRVNEREKIKNKHFTGDIGDDKNK